MNHDQLRKLAEAATPGEWIADIEVIQTEDGDVYDSCSVMRETDRIFGPTIETPEDAHYIAAANPQMILQLLDKIQELEDMTDTVRTDEVSHCPFCSDSLLPSWDHCPSCGAKIYQMGSKLQNRNLPRITMESGDLIGRLDE